MEHLHTLQMETERLEAAGWGREKREGGPAADAVLATEEKRWSRRRRDALS